MMKKLLIAAGATLLFLTIYFLWPRAPRHEGGPVIPLAEREVAAEGKVEAMPGLDVTVGTELFRRIGRFYVREGDRVSKGEVIARLESADLQTRIGEAEKELAVAEARLAETASGAREEEVRRAQAVLEGAMAESEVARKELDRYRNLRREEMIPQSLLEEKERIHAVASARVRAAEEELRLLEKGAKPETLRLLREERDRAAASVASYRAILEKSVLTAPISGVVVHKYLEEGEMTNPELPVAAIADVERLWVNAEVDETDIGRLRVGAPAEVSSSTFPGKVFHGEVRRIGEYVGKREVQPNNPAVNLGLKVIQVKIGLLDETPFKIGMTVDVKIGPGGK